MQEREAAHQGAMAQHEQQVQQVQAQMREVVVARQQQLAQKEK
jgi:hypothetical protein